MTNSILICYNIPMMKNKTTKNLIILGAIVFSFAFANNAFAYTCVGYTCYDSYNPTYSSGYSPSYNPRNVPQNNYQDYYAYNPNVVQNVQNVQTPTPVVNNYYYPTTTRVVTSTVPSATTTNTTTNTTNNTTTTPTETPVVVDSSNPTGNNLGASAAGITALSLRGSGSFMPSSIWQWMLVVILILAIIIIARIMIRKSQESKLIQETHITH